jgi:TolB protein
MNGEERDQVCIINADGTGWRQLTDNSKHNWYASLSPDGQTVVFSSNVSGDYEIYEVSAYGGMPVRLTWELGGKLYAPEISPDGRKIVFTYDRDGDQTVWVMNRDGSATDSLAIGWDPSWSPDGRQILYAANSSGGAVQLYVMNADGSNQRQVTNLSKLRGRSDWSPLGLIATYAGDYGKRSLWVMNSDGSGAQEFFFNPTSAAPSFSPDGQWMAFTGYLDYPNDLDKGCEIYIVRVGEMNAIRLTKNRYCDWQPRWGP